MADLHNTFYKILKEYQDVYQKVWKTKKFKDDLLTYFNTDAKKEVEMVVKNKNPKLLIKSSTGTGKTTDTPWIAVLDNRITKKASEGTYIAYLFNKNEKCLYLTLEQSINEAKERIKNRGLTAKNLTQAVDNLLKNEKTRIINLISCGSFITNTEISTGKYDYDKTAVMYKKYDMNNLPDNEVLEQDLYELIDIYSTYYDECVVKGIEKVEILEVEANQVQESIKVKEVKYENQKKEASDMVLDKEVKGIVEKIHEYILAEGYVYSQELINNFYLALKSKPFVILAGISGTGKSKLVEYFAKAISAKYNMVSVRPDWSDTTDLLGHLDLEGKYVEGPVIEFISQANNNLNKPYVLCFDEMNLARVEYYFSDVLSIIETRNFNGQYISTRKILADSTFGHDSDARNKYKNLYLSENLYLIGTVNMDETTFPFSKKVLDRANTIEFSDVDMELLIDIRKVDNIPSLFLDNSFLKSEYLKVGECLKNAKNEVENVVKMLIKLNEHLKKSNAQVAYRVRDEICYYISYNQRFKLMTYDEALDNAILQKILPRIQGSSMVVKDILVSLFGIAVGASVSIFQKNDNEVGERMQAYLKSENKILYSKSAVKIAFMTRRYEDDGFTSYWI